MTYQEATDLIDANKYILCADTLNCKQKHSIKGTFIAPENSSTHIQETIFIECNENVKTNKDTLLALNLFFENLKPFIVIRITGDNIIIPLNSYVDSELFSIKGNLV